jgi:hypothetical protein
VGVTIERARLLVLALPQVTEQDHHGMAPFRVHSMIFATVPDDEHLRVMVDEAEIRAAVLENPAFFHEFYWGKRLACLVVDLSGTTLEHLRELLTEAWLGKAPASLVQQLSDRPKPTRH